MIHCIVGRTASCLLGLVASCGMAAAAPSIPDWDNWTDPAGVSHLTRCAMRQFALKSASGPATPEWQDQQPEPARTLLTHVERLGWNGDWHENPKVQWVVPLTERWCVQAMDGTHATIGPGELIVGEDQQTRPDAVGHSGHLSRNDGSVSVTLMIVQLAGRPVG